jgi:hypothetical protein
MQMPWLLVGLDFDPWPSAGEPRMDLIKPASTVSRKFPQATTLHARNDENGWQHLLGAHRDGACGNKKSDPKIAFS